MLATLLLVVVVGQVSDPLPTVELSADTQGAMLAAGDLRTDKEKMAAAMANAAVRLRTDGAYCVCTIGSDFAVPRDRGGIMADRSRQRSSIVFVRAGRLPSGPAQLDLPAFATTLGRLGVPPTATP